jgi:hypothetical protein
MFLENFKKTFFFSKKLVSFKFLGSHFSGKQWSFEKKINYISFALNKL